MAYPQPMPMIQKDPSALLDYGFDLSVPARPFETPWLAAGETITSLTVTADTGVTVASQGIFNNASGVASRVIAWIAGGVAGTVYLVHFFFTTSAGRQDTRTLTLNVVQR